MKQPMKMLMYGIVTTFLFSMVLAALFWPYLQAERRLNQPTDLLNLPITEQSNQPEAAALDLASLQVAAQSRSLIYQEQIDRLQAAIEAREATYQGQLAEANAQLTTYQAAITQIQQEVDALNAEIDRLAQLTADRQTTYQTQLSGAIEEMNLYRTELVNQLATARQTLAEAKANLGQ